MNNTLRMPGRNKLNLINRRSLKIWIILLLAALLAFLIWRYFDIQIEKLKMKGQ
jgi:small neutral amino acid transporter SnatA (MarC family)